MKRQIMLPLLCLLSLATCLVSPPVKAVPKVINLKKLLDSKIWRLDITYTAKDSFENREITAGLEMTATATYYLERLDRGEAWGHWQALNCQSFNHSYKSFRQNKHLVADRTEYHSKLGGTMIAPLADLQIGGATPGYMLIVNGGFPSEMRTQNGGALDHPLLLGTTIKDQPGLSGVATGPLPESGTTIPGSRVIPFEIPPFLTGVAGMTRMGVEFVLQPDDRLAPLTPP